MAPTDPEPEAPNGKELNDALLDRLRTLAGERCITIGQLAAAVGEGSPSMSRTLTKGRRMPAWKIPLLARVLGVSVEEILMSPEDSDRAAEEGRSALKSIGATVGVLRAAADAADRTARGLEAAAEAAAEDLAGAEAELRQGSQRRQDAARMRPAGGRPAAAPAAAQTSTG